LLPKKSLIGGDPRFVSVGLALAEIEGVPTVIKVDTNSAAQRAGLRAGDVIESVDGEQRWLWSTVV
jgi:C-terminal processing protease CtpA/Prc